MLQELNLFYSRDVNGVCLLYDLLHSPWLQALLKVSAQISINTRELQECWSPAPTTGVNEVLVSRPASMVSLQERQSWDHGSA